MSLVDGVLQIEREACSACSQCVAVCPEQAISWNGNTPLPFESDSLPTPAQLDELFKERRSIGYYKRKKIDRALLREIVGYGAYAPSHSHRLRAIVVDDDGIVKALDRVLLRYISRMYRAFFRPRVMAVLARIIGLSREHTLAKPKLESALARGQAFNHPAAMAFIVGEKRYALQEASAQYILANIMYYAQAKGIGGCLWANGPMLIDKSRKARWLLGIGRGERISGAVFLG